MAEKFKAAEVAEALKAAKGLVSVAARRLACDRVTVYRYIRDYPTVAQALEDSREEMKDFAESKLFLNIDKGDDTAIIFYLKTQAKDRGYVERQEQRHVDRDGNDAPLKLSWDD